LPRLVGGAINSWGWADKEATKLAINSLVECTRNRPHPWSTASDYTSWKSLTDRTYQARHLPAVAPGVQPPTADVQKLFARPDRGQVLSEKSTCLFPAFAQYLTDGFIRTDQHHRDRTTSNHEIDLSPLYGRTESQTNILRANIDTPGRRGRLKSQMIDGEEYPPFLYTRDGTAIDPAFDPGPNPVPGVHLDLPLMGKSKDPSPPPEQLASLFAVGGDRANATPFTSMMNTLFLREHNRVAGELERQNPQWNDERVFQTARNIMIPMFIKIVVEQYINHISPLPFNLVCDPSVAWTANWNRPNWISAEFSLLYRWHSLMPDTIAWPGPDGPIPLETFPLDNRPLIRVGLAKAFSAAAGQAAADLGALNTHWALMRVEAEAIGQARSNRLATYNAYRVQFGMPPAQKFTDITSDARIQAMLSALYGTPDHVEFYPGLFAEDRVHNSPLPGLLGRMVAVDAFSQALTNPLLSEHVYNEQTFTPWGFQLIQDTISLGTILKRQGAAVDIKTITMTQPTWNYGGHVP
jgi:prostaglandin-endoperoxide synthase 2